MSKNSAVVCALFVKACLMSEVRSVMLSVVLRPGRNPECIGDMCLCLVM